MQRVYCFARNVGSAHAVDASTVVASRKDSRSHHRPQRVTAKATSTCDGVLDADAQVARLADAVVGQVEGKDAFTRSAAPSLANVDGPGHRLRHAVQLQHSGEGSLPLRHFRIEALQFDLRKYRHIEPWPFVTSR